jgi:hypothetical protein
MRVPSLWPHCRLPGGEVEEMLHRQLPSLMASKGRERQVPGEALWAFPGLDKGGSKGGVWGGGAGAAGAAAAAAAGAAAAAVLAPLQALGARARWRSCPPLPAPPSPPPAPLRQPWRRWALAGARTAPQSLA